MNLNDNRVKSLFELALESLKPMLSEEGKNLLPESLKLWGENHLKKSNPFYDLLELVSFLDHAVCSRDYYPSRALAIRHENEWLLKKIATLDTGRAELGWVIRDQLEKNWGNRDLWRHCALDALKRILPDEYAGLDPEAKEVAE